ncbi:uncharacterized protein LOC131173948 isoform X1 [Hevea brasiliensis]|uniref:uncharacterized protein LOC131173948 isoform X1 n=1 Tax=Hevea brasiliensis TaxID=3981 RepID=UPI0025E347A1|nr:uncharacterized protein LOC131173948 isoform X1 [Hevea brasiliensis]
MSEQNAARVAQVEAQVQDLTRQLREFMSVMGGTNEKGTDIGISGSSSRLNTATGPEERLELRQTGGMVPRYAKLEFPTYDGSYDPLIWLYCCEQFFLNQKTPETEKVSLATFHMIGEVQLWFYKLEQEEAGLLWHSFKEYCNLRFGPLLRGNPLGELINLKQTGTVEEYQKQFQSLLARANSVRTDQQVNFFTAGLFEVIRLDVEMQNPPNLGTAMNLARAFEKKQQLASVSNSQCNFWNNSRITAPAQSVTKPTGSGGNNAPASRGESVIAPFVKRLSRTEMADRRENGLCYNCDEPYTFGHQCKKLFWLELEEGAITETEESENVAVAEPSISLHAITGLQHSRTMQLIANIKGCLVTVLIDSGSTQNFISKIAAQKLGATLDSQSALQVAVANGEKIHSMGTCKETIQVSGEHFPVDLYVIPLDGFDVVLGVRWLMTSGPIWWNFSTLTMCFELGNRQVTLEGLQPEHRPRLQLLNEQQA